LSNRSK